MCDLIDLMNVCSKICLKSSLCITANTLRKQKGDKQTLRVELNSDQTVATVSALQSADPGFFKDRGGSSRIHKSCTMLELIFPTHMRSFCIFKSGAAGD